MKKFILVFITSIFLAFSCSTTDTVKNDPDDDLNLDDKLISEVMNENIDDTDEPEIIDLSGSEQEIAQDDFNEELLLAEESSPAQTAAAGEIPAEPQPELAEQIFQVPSILTQPPAPLLTRAPPPEQSLPQLPAQPSSVQTPPAAQTPSSQTVTLQAAQPNTGSSAANSPPVIQAAAQPLIPVVSPAAQIPSATQTLPAQLALPAAQTPPAQTLPFMQTPQAPQYTEPPVKIDPYQNEPFSNLPPAPSMGIESRTQMGMTPQDSELIFSRIVRATVGQIVEIPFRGNNWIYLGELASRRGIVYNSRRNDPDGQSFIFTLEDAGAYVLKFYRQDFIRDYIINDHVQVIAGEAPAATAGWFNPSVDRGRVIAEPRWPSVLEEAQIRNGQRPDTVPVVSGNAPDLSAVQGQTAQQSAAVTPAAAQIPASQTPSAVSQAAAVSPNASQLQSADNLRQVNDAAAQTVPAAPERLPPDVILHRAKESFDRGNVAGAISSLNQYMQYYPGGSDEAYWMMGQFYEANSPERNILLSLDYYKKLVNEYPQSARFADARSRIAYLERFYINIR